MSDIPQHRDIGLDTSSLFKTGNTANLLEKIKYKLANPGVIKNRKDFLSEYDWDRIAEKTYVVYEALI